MAKEKTMRWIAFRVAGVATVLAMASVALVSSPAAATGKVTTTTVTAPSPRTGESITFTATVTRGTGTPTGSVTFSITGTDSSTPFCDNTSDTNVVTLAPAVTGSSAQCTISAGLFAAASPYAVMATYTPDANSSDLASSTGMLSEVVRKGVTNTSLTSMTNPSVTGGPVQFTAAVAPVSPSTGMPTGTVTFSIVGTGGAVPCDLPGGNSPTLDGSDMAQCSVGAGLLAANSPYTVTAVYSGDTNYQTSTGTLTQNVNKAAVTLSLSSSPASIVTGQPVAFTATITGITPPGMGTPMGSIVFSVVGSNGTTMATCQGGDTITLSGSPLGATCNFPKGLPANLLSWTVTATLQDPNFRSPMGGASLVQPVSRAAINVTLGTLPGSLVASQAFSFTVTFKTVAPGTGAPTGYFEWAVCPEGQPMCTPQTGTRGESVALPTPTKMDREKNRNVATVSVPYGLAPGFYEVEATYFQNPNQSGGSSSPLGHIYVVTIPTTMQLVLGHNPVRSGGSLKIRSLIMADPRATGTFGAPTGTVTFVIKGQSGDKLTCKTGSNVVTISTTLKNQGNAKCAIASGQLTTSDVPYSIRAQYSGDSNYQPVSSSESLVVETPAG